MESFGIDKKQEQVPYSSRKRSFDDNEHKSESQKKPKRSLSRGRQTNDDNFGVLSGPDELVKSIPDDLPSEEKVTLFMRNAALYSLGKTLSKNMDTDSVAETLNKYKFTLDHCIDNFNAEIYEKADLVLKTDQEKKSFHLKKYFERLNEEVKCWEELNQCCELQPSQLDVNKHGASCSNSQETGNDLSCIWKDFFQKKQILKFQVEAISQARLAVCHKLKIAKKHLDDHAEQMYSQFGNNEETKQLIKSLAES